MSCEDKTLSALLRPLHLAVIDPAVRVPELDNFNRMVLAAPELSLSFHLPALFGMTSLSLVPQKPDALVIFGSGASVYEGLPWQDSLNAWLLERIREGLPILGICYGHQLLAHLLGGTVEFIKADRYKFKGLRTVQFSKRGFWGEAGTSGRFIVSHAEAVTTLPQDTEIVASSDVCKVEAFAHKHLPIWGIQAHPEAGPDFVQNQNIDVSLEERPYAFGQEFIRKFIQHLQQHRIQ